MEDAICYQPSVPAFDLSRNVYKMENLQKIKSWKKWKSNAALRLDF